MANLRETTRRIRKSKRFKAHESQRRPLEFIKDIPPDMGPNLRSGVAAAIRNAKKPAKTRG